MLSFRLQLVLATFTFLCGCGAGGGGTTATTATTPTSPAVAPSTPAVSLSSGVLTLTGSNFGTKVTAAPIRFETFEGSDGDYVHSAGWWSIRSGASSDTPPKIKSGVSRVAGQNVADLSTTNINTPTVFRNGVGFKITKKAYINFWAYLDLSSFDGVAVQIKLINILRNTNTVTADNEYPDQSTSLWNDMSNSTSGTLARYYFSGGSAPILSFKDGINNNIGIFNTPGWYNFAIQVDQGTLGQSDGNTTLYLVGPGYTKYGVSTDSTNVMLIDGGDYLDSLKLWQYLQFRTSFTNSYDFLNAYAAGYPLNSRVNYIGKGYRCILATGPRGSFTLTPDVDTTHWQEISATPLTISDTVYIDSLYIDNSFARVEMCDSPVWTTRTHCEMQIPISWNSVQISATYKKGSFSSGDTVYFFVVNESGNVSQAGGSFTLP